MRGVCRTWEKKSWLRMPGLVVSSIACLRKTRMTRSPITQCLCSGTTINSTPRARECLRCLAVGHVILWLLVELGNQPHPSS